MATKKLYEAHLIGKDGVKVDNVDMTCLPYDEINNLNKLYIEEDVDMGKGKKQPLPDMSNVVIHGSFNTSDWIITPGTVLPSGITELNCAHSINGLEVLMDILEPTVQTVVVRPAILNNIKNDKDGALEIARKFVKKYPDVIVTDGKKLFLSELLEEIDKEKSNVIVEKVDVTPKQEQETIGPKTPDWVDYTELEEICLKSPSWKGTLDRDVLKRCFRMALSEKSGVGKKINKSEKIRDGVVVMCVHRDNVEAVSEFMCEKYKEKSQTSAKTEKAAKKSDKKTVERSAEKTIAANAPQKVFVNDKELSEIVIEKYIPESVLGQLALNDQITLLQEVAKVNIQPFELKKQQVHYIENGTVIRLPNLEFKNARVLSQKIQPRDNRRIVWYMDGNKFYAVYYFAKHDKSHEYNLALQADNAKIDDVINFVKKNIADAKEKGLDISVNGWLQRLSSHVAEKESKKTKKRSAGGAATTKTTKKSVPESLPKQPVVNPEKVATPKGKGGHPPKAEMVVSVKAQPVAEPVVASEVTKRKRPRFQKPIDLSHVKVFREGGIAVEDFATATNNVAEQEKQYLIATLFVSEKNLHWNDIDEMHETFTVRYSTAKGVAQKLVRQLSTETDTEKMLVATDKLQRVLKQKQFYEKALAKLNGFKSELNQMQQEYSKIK